MENQAGWHGAAISRAQLDDALAELGAPELTPELVARLTQESNRLKQRNRARCRAALPSYSSDYWWNAQPDRMQVEMDPSRMGFGRALERLGQDERVVTLHADISSSIRISDFEAGHPERASRVYSLGIAEQNMLSVACGLARAGRIPVGGTYGVFACGRNWDQWRTMACYGNLNVKMAGAHGGLSVGPDGATHQALEEIALLAVLPNMHLAVPADTIETQKATAALVLEVVGPGYIRYAREATPVVTKPDTPYRWGVANVIRFRGARDLFVEAFETVLSPDYVNEHEALTIVACGPMVAEAMRAAWILKEETGLETRVLNMHTIKPLDEEAILAAVAETGGILVVEEHNVIGGLGSAVADVIAHVADEEVEEAGLAGVRPAGDHDASPSFVQLRGLVTCGEGR